VYRPLYNIQFMPDLDSGLILAYEVFAQATDSGTLPTMLERYQQATGRCPKELLTDSSYATALDLALCERKQVTLYAPYQENPFTAAKRAARPAKQLPKEAFTWLAEEQTYRCPEGHQLERHGWEYKRRKGEQKLQVFTYRCPAEHCRNCPRQPECTSRPESGRTVKRSAHEDLVEALNADFRSAPNFRAGPHFS
jgi:hypothetical protein